VVLKPRRNSCQSFLSRKLNFNPASPPGEATRHLVIKSYHSMYARVIERLEDLKPLVRAIYCTPICDQRLRGAKYCKSTRLFDGNTVIGLCRNTQNFRHLDGTFETSLEVLSMFNVVLKKKHGIINSVLKVSGPSLFLCTERFAVLHQQI
jgi:hypothetical protein